MLDKSTKDQEITPKTVSALLTNHYKHLLSEFYEMQSIFLTNVYKKHGNIESANIILCFARNLHLAIVRQREKRLNYDLSFQNLWFNLNNISKPNEKIISIADLTGIPKETVRRKMNDLVKNQYILKNNSKQYTLNISQKIKEDFLKNYQNEINILSKFLYEFSKKIEIDLTIDEVKKEVMRDFSFYWYHFLSCQLIWLRMWMKKIKDFDLILISLQALIPTLQFFHENDNPKKINLRNIHNFIGKTTCGKYQNANNSSINATSISEISGIPRATCIRKLSRLVDLGFLVKETKSKRYFVNQNTSAREKNIITKDAIESTILIFSEFLATVLNSINRKKKN